jgi:alkane 1-monooxygenase
MIVGGPVDEAAGDDQALIGAAGRRFYAANLYATAPLIALLTVAHLLAIKSIAEPSDATLGSMLAIAGMTFAVGYFYALTGATVAHELSHWTSDSLAQFLARVLLSFTFNAGFPIYHVHGHHRNVALYQDAATARRGEHVFVYVARTTIGQLVEAFQIEAEHLRRANRSPWSWRNRALSAQAYPILIGAVAWLIAGVPGMLVFLGAAFIGRFIHELMNYVQHYGLVRAEGTPIQPHHTWDCHRWISNALQYNLPRHAHHHMVASRPFWDLGPSEKAPTLPYGYQTMALIALVSPLWRKTMRPLLDDWDRRFASETERRAIRERGWEGRA